MVTNLVQVRAAGLARSASFERLRDLHPILSHPHRRRLEPVPRPPDDLSQSICITATSPTSADPSPISTSFLFLAYIQRNSAFLPCCYLPAYPGLSSRKTITRGSELQNDTIARSMADCLLENVLPMELLSE